MHVCYKQWVMDGLKNYDQRVRDHFSKKKSYARRKRLWEIYKLPIPEYLNPLPLSKFSKHKKSLTSTSFDNPESAEIIRLKTEIFSFK